MDAELSGVVAKNGSKETLDPREVQTRDDLAVYLSASLPGDYTMVLGEGEVRNVATHAKSYLIEAHSEARRPLADRLSLAFREVVQLPDRSLYRVSGDDVVFFLDAGDPRPSNGTAHVQDLSHRRTAGNRQLGATNAPSGLHRPGGGSANSRLRREVSGRPLSGL